MAARGWLNLALGVTLAITSPALMPVLGGVASADAPGAPTSTQIEGQVSTAVANVKASAAYQNGTAAQKALLLAQAVQGVVAAALTNGASADTIGAAMNVEVSQGVVSGAVAVEGTALAAVQVQQASGANSPAGQQAAAATADVQGQSAVSASIAASGGGQVGVTAVNGSGQTVTTLVPLSAVLTAAASGNLTSSGQVTGTTTSTGTASPCSGVIADYC